MFDDIKLILLNQNRWIFIIAFSFFILLLLAWELAPYFYGFDFLSFPSIISYTTFSEKNSWLLLASRIAEGNLFPILPSIDSNISQFSHYPYLTIWFHGALLFLFGITGSFFIGHVVFPALTFLLLSYIFSRHLSSLWSILLSYVTIISFMSLSLREFFIGLLQGKLLITHQPIEVAHFPFPSFSIFCFLFLYLLSSQRRHLSYLGICMLSVLWAIQLQVHPLNGLFGILFWVFYLKFRLNYDFSGKSFTTIFKIFTIQIILICIFSLPSIIATFDYFQWTTITQSVVLSGIELENIRSGVTFSFYLLAYVFIPVFLFILAYYIDRVDPFEISHRFSPFVSLFLAEVITQFFVWNFDGAAFSFNSRLAIFCHFFYIVPFIYFLSRPISISRYRGSEALPVFIWLRNILNQIVSRYKYIYLFPLGIVLIIFYMASLYHRTIVMSGLENSNSITPKMLTKFSSSLPPGCVLATDDYKLNLHIPLFSNCSTLWVDGFSNRLPSKDIISRFALYFKLFEISEEDFIEFMTPKLENRDSISLDKFDILKSGLGYWMTFARADIIKHSSEKIYRKRIQEIYREVNLPQFMNKFDALRIISVSNLSYLKHFKKIGKVNNAYIYKYKPHL